MTVRDALSVLIPGAAEDVADAPDAEPVVIALIGASYLADSSALPRFAADLDQAVRTGANRIVVDLRAAGPVGTRALNALLATRERLLRKGGQVVLVAPPQLRRFCELTGLNRRFRLARDRLEAAELLGFMSTPGSQSHARDWRAA